MNQLQRIAPAVPSRQSSDRRPGGSSPGPDATPIINDQMAVRSRGWGVPRRQRCVLPFDRIFVGIGERSTALQAIKHSRLTSHFQCVSEANPHFKLSVRYALKASDGASHCAEQISQGRGNV